MISCLDFYLMTEKEQQEINNILFCYCLPTRVKLAFHVAIKFNVHTYNENGQIISKLANMANIIANTINATLL